MPLKIAAFPKCFIDQIAGDRSMSVFDWIEMSGASMPTVWKCTTGFSPVSRRRISTRSPRRLPRPALPCPCSAARPISRTPIPIARKRAMSARWN